MSDFLSDLQFVTPEGKNGRGPGRIGRVILILLWLALGIMPIVFSVPDFQLATGRLGTPGTLTVESCESLGKGRYDCKGLFLPDDGGPAVPVAASPDSTAGDVTPAQLTPEGDRAVPNGTRGVLAAMTLPALGLGCLGFLPYVIAYWAGTRRRAAVWGGWAVTTLGLIGVIVGMVAAYS
ncbi:hypothetical protein HII36_45875 [Nonomuraea sp. NN258]|uniref:hypothetical protein n=1 Tax=Nonomuraea antri TaxID=2730852 RepID=UPI00156A137D|nr:hypothetical protein [Nonomuraea antri]NRQ39105.1 hypothetical protein [Nonomuraea antri]